MQRFQSLDLFKMNRPKLLVWAGEGTPVVVVDSPCSASELTNELRSFICEQYLATYTCPGRNLADVEIHDYNEGDEDLWMND